ncbi:Uma2 family endonuclease [Pimelobacter simplex]|uniref:Uma2 family endonuclease n=1 Tax=Nocardioides simplex TaxID=2045 RepID=UPI00367303D1
MRILDVSTAEGAPMSALSPPPWPQRLERVPMSLAEFLALPEKPKAEYVDGEAIVMPPSSRGHNRVQWQVAQLLKASLAPELDVALDAGWRHAGRLRIPDIAVFETDGRDDDVVWDDDVPILVVEVLSPSTAGEDKVRKSREYQRAGVAQYWMVDRAQRTLSVDGNAGDGWDRLLDLDDEHPAGSVVVGTWGEVAVDLRALLQH